MTGSWHIFPASRFAELRGAWDALNDHGPRSPVLSSGFVGSALEVFGTGKERLAVYGDLEAPLAMGLFQSRRLVAWETFQPSQAPLGAWLNATGESLETLVASLARCLPGIVLQVGLTQQDPDITPRPADTARLQTLDYIETARITLDGSFEDYWAQRGKNLRHNLKRQRNRLERERIAVRLEQLTAPGDMARAVTDFGSLESAGWKADGGTAIHAGNAQGSFYTKMLEAFAKVAAAKVFRLFYGDKLVASDLCIAQAGTLVILKTTYDESQDTSSPALLMRQEAFPSLFADGALRRIEFYGKVMEWHTKWSEEIRRLYHVNYRPWSTARRSAPQRAREPQVPGGE
jgi:CelD/BcsL family acetyltransferase involved in cellulose biosynthesis